jgi:aspartyl protease family protein
LLASFGEGKGGKGSGTAMRNDFFEPEKGPSMIGWAARQLVLWLVGGLAVYALFVNRSGFLPEHQAAKPAAPALAASVRSPGEPSRAAAAIVSNSLTLRAGRDGHVYSEVNVNGVPIRMVVDTGATEVVLTLRDAAAIGFSAGSLSFTGRSSTANGVTRVAPITLREVRIGQLEIRDVHAAVVEHLDVSLLGQTFLRRLDSYEMRDGVLTMSWQ